MAERSKHQQKIIKNYYENRDAISLQRLSELVTELYLAALSRKPVEGEMAAAVKHIGAAADRRLALEDVGWAILNSKEFLFQH